MSLLQVGLTLLTGGIVAFLLTLFGGGGSVLAVPLLLYMVGVREPHVAIGASAAGVALNAATALVGHAAKGRVRWRIAGLFAAFGALGALAGSTVAKSIDGHQLLLFFALAMAAVGLAMLRPNAPQGSAEASLSRANGPAVAGMGTAVGAASGFFGIGGGFLIVPGLMRSAGLTLPLAQAASLVSVATFGAVTSLNYAASGLINWRIVVAMTAGGILGALAGQPVAQALGEKARTGRVLFAGLILLAAAYVAWKAVMAL
ncbi:sulfite exporter TauE/SafE family protein [Brevundimonas sp. 2R-24]|uniref:Probable membrane transporter protein n=1 Tax=Peiella sedimenti TaxID=3061083 RepID=A0ABT8SKW7_9CAUL|nr:sulfite exporter TauE/SafE family protein [Caulobacteraceae bacterium XZ-24]